MNNDQASRKDVGFEQSRKKLKEYVISRSETFIKLNEMREKGWKNKQGDEHFRKQRDRADTADHKQRTMFFKMMCQIGKELEGTTRAISISNTNKPLILDTCAAPGGFVSTALHYNPTASVCAMTLPTELGGHHLLVPYGLQDPRVTVQFMDITKLGLEYGLKHTELQPGMTADRPYLNIKFDLVFCDGHVLRTNEEHRDVRTEQYAATRLTCSQLIVALNRIRSGGTLIMLLHKVETLDSFDLLASFSRFADIQLFKPARCHATRSSFYLVAKHVNPTCEAATTTLEVWKQRWRQSTLVGLEEVRSGGGCEEMQVPDLDAALLLFGEQFIQLADPIWDAQRAALENAPWNKDAT